MIRNMISVIKRVVRSLTTLEFAVSLHITAVKTFARSFSRVS